MLNQSIVTLGVLTVLWLLPPLRCRPPGTCTTTVQAAVSPCRTPLHGWSFQLVVRTTTSSLLFAAYTGFERRNGPVGGAIDVGLIHVFSLFNVFILSSFLFKTTFIDNSTKNLDKHVWNHRNELTGLEYIHCCSLLEKKLRVNCPYTLIPRNNACNLTQA